uniref:TLC domain-containing protein n=1 Tax=Anopheles epiroticus TaxID=199890 RepID=A0A182P8J0_9DIPT
MAVVVLLQQLRSLRSWLLSSEHGFGDTLNAVFWVSCLLGLTYAQFRLLVQILLRSARVRAHQHGAIVYHLWNICFNACATSFLLLYQVVLIRPEVMRESAKLFPQYINAIFATPCDASKLEIVTVVLVAFRVFTTVRHLSRSDYSVAFSGALHAALLLGCCTLRLENYSILLNMYLAIYGVCAETILLLATRTTRPHWWTILALLKCSAWIHLFLYRLPFEFLIPTLYARRELLPLKVCYWLWYCSCVWNSPLLKLLYHKIYHLHPNDCAGGESACRCILSNDWQAFRHIRALKQAYLELQLLNARQDVHKYLANEQAAKAAFQTIKCVMTLKRKVKRMRENKEQGTSKEKQS